MNNNLVYALKSVLFNHYNDDLVDYISQILVYTLENEGITTRKIQNISGDEYEDLLLILFEKRLIIPASSYRGLEWQDRAFSLDINEKYKMPKIIKNLVKIANKSGTWNLKESIIDTFKKIGEKDYDKMPTLVNKLYENSENYRINGNKIRKICKDLNLEDRAGALISELKGIGIISPQLSVSLFSSLKERTPIYELNPSLF